MHNVWKKCCPLLVIPWASAVYTRSAGYHRIVLKLFKAHGAWKYIASRRLIGFTFDIILHENLWIAQDDLKKSTIQTNNSIPSLPARFICQHDLFSSCHLWLKLGLGIYIFKIHIYILQYMLLYLAVYILSVISSIKSWKKNYNLYTTNKMYIHHIYI